MDVLISIQGGGFFVLSKGVLSCGHSLALLFAFSLPPGLLYFLSASVDARQHILDRLMHGELLHRLCIQALVVQWLIVVLGPNFCVGSTPVACPNSSTVVPFPSLGFH